MQQLRQLLASLSTQQKITIGVVAALVIGALYAFANWHKEQDFKPLYTGVAPEDAAAIVQKIKEAGVEYRLSDNGGVISVPSAKVAELRLDLAAAGLPKTGRIGYEIFDKTNFAATDFVEHINYNRALEGELERSIDSLAAIEASRVHITPPKDSVFVESREPGKASVIVRLRAGTTLFPQNVAAIQQLVSSAVEGVSPDDVSVVDTRGSLLSRRKLAQDDGTDAVYSYRERLEHDLVEKINGTLEPLLGRDRFHAGVSVDCDLTTSEQNEETYDPTKSVMVSSQKTEEVIAGGATAGIPGTATNLPRPAARAGGPTNTTNRRTENITYESSHVVRKTHIPEGQVKRVSVSVLIAQKMRWEGKGNNRHPVPIPPSQDELKAVHDLIAGVVGFSQERGDQITIESLPFENNVDDGLTQAAPAGPASSKFDWKDLLHGSMLIASSIGALVLLLLLIGGVVLVMKSLKKGKVRKAEPGATALPKVATAEELLEQAKNKASLQAANMTEQMEAVLAEKAAEQQKAELAALASMKLPTVTTKKSDLLSKELRETSKKDPSIPAHVISTWLHDDV